MVRDRAVRLIPSAPLGLAPHDTTLVNIQTIMWVDAPKTRTLPAVAILGRQVVITITLDHVAWSFGDGHSDTSNGPGTPYSRSHPCTTAQCPGYFGHTYLDTGSNSVTATASWTASFTVDGGAATTIPGTIAGPTARTTLAVKQARSVLTPNPGN